MSLLIRGGKLVLPEGIYESDVLIEDERIKAIGKRIKSELADEVIDATGKLVFPGVVDEHVHMREPGLEYKDDFSHGTMAAALGGVTTVIEMPNTVPPVDSGRTVKDKAELLKNKAHVDFALYGLLSDNSVDRLEEMLNEGAVGFKAFLGPTTGNLPPPSNATIYKALKLSRALGFPIAFHAEDDSLVNYFVNEVKSSGRKDALAHMLSRPPITEEMAVMKIYMMAKDTDGKAHIVHVSSKGTLDYLRKAKEEGVRLTGETCPHYLYFDSSHYERYGSYLKVNPPIREAEHREALLKALEDSTIFTIGSDHAPHSIQEKGGGKDIWEVAAGFAGVQTLLLSMVSLALNGTLKLSNIPRLISRNPAKLFGLWPKKGELMPGSDADIAIVDPNKETLVTEEWLITKSPITPFLGMRFKGNVELTILRGEIIAKNGEMEKKNRGSMVRKVTSYTQI